MLAKAENWFRPTYVALSVVEELLAILAELRDTSSSTLRQRSVRLLHLESGATPDTGDRCRQIQESGSLISNRDQDQDAINKARATMFSTVVPSHRCF